MSKYGYSKKECVEEFLFSIHRALAFTKKKPGFNVPKEFEKFEAILEDIIKQVGPIEEQLFRAQWNKEAEEEDF